MYAVTPDVIACDAHPDYLSTAYAARRGIPVQRVQHHLAHVLGVHGRERGGAARPGRGVGRHRVRTRRDDLGRRVPRRRAGTRPQGCGACAVRAARRRRRHQGAASRGPRRPRIRLWRRGLGNGRARAGRGLHGRGAPRDAGYAGAGAQRAAHVERRPPVRRGGRDRGHTPARPLRGAGGDGTRVRARGDLHGRDVPASSSAGAGSRAGSREPRSRKAGSCGSTGRR